MILLHQASHSLHPSSLHLRPPATLSSCMSLSSANIIFTQNYWHHFNFVAAVLGIHQMKLECGNLTLTFQNVHLKWEILLGGNTVNRTKIHFHLGDIFMAILFPFRWEIILQAVFIIKHCTRLGVLMALRFQTVDTRLVWAHEDRQIQKRQSLFHFGSVATLLYAPSILIGFCSERTSHCETELDVLLKM